jgi:hypothetical protein
VTLVTNRGFESERKMVLVQAKVGIEAVD